MEIYWVGIRESEIKYTNFVKDSITIFGNNNISMQNKLNRCLNHNDSKNFTIIDDFFNKEIQKIIQEKPHIKFMYYSQINSYRSMEKLGLLNHVICLNNQDLIEKLSNKFKLKKYFKNYVPVLDYILIKGQDLCIAKIQQELPTKTSEYVIQTAIGSGGSGTFLINSKNENNLIFNKNQNYMVSKYCQDNIPLNVHVLISDQEIELLPPSLQIIELSDNKLIYKGCDYIAYQKLISNQLNQKMNNYSYIIASHLQKMGYKGICGIDYILYNNEIYLMEINTRFQNSSTILNKSLQENNLPSLQELHYNCFYNKKIKLPKFTVNYSCYINENTESNTTFPMNYIEELDSIDKNISKEQMTYLGSFIFDKSIYRKE